MCSGFQPDSWKEAVLPFSPSVPNGALRVSGVLEMQKNGWMKVQKNIFPL